MEKEKKIILNITNSPFFKDVAGKSMIDVAKNNKLSNTFRREANQIFNNQLHNSSSHEEIWKLYSKSIALAEVGSDELAMAYANRSAILLHMSKYEASLMDIDRALNITKNNCLQMKLLIRKAKCLYALGSDQSEIALVETELLLERVQVKNLKEMFVNDITETKFTLKKPFEQLEASSMTIRKRATLKTLNKLHEVDDFSSIDVQYTKKSGRHLVATRDIHPGEIIYIEKPYVHSVNMENTHLYCYHCLTATWANIPCDHCAWAMFCSEECKQKSWEEYHNIECSLYSFTKQALDDSCTQLAIKALCSALKEHSGIENLKAELAKFDKRKDDRKGFVKNGKIRTNGFKTMYILSSDVAEFKMQEHIESAALFLSNLLKCSELLSAKVTSNAPSSANSANNFVPNRNATFLSALFLRLSTVTEINKLEMWNGSYKCPNGSVLKSHCCRNECCSKGAYIAPITSLINHSCNPNVNVCYSDDHKAIVYALQPIKRGQQLTRCYKDEFFLVGKSSRVGLLKNIYNFECKCVACQNNWPSLTKALPTRCKRTIDSAYDGSANYNEKIIGLLGRDLEGFLKILPQPAAITIDLMRTLSIIFGQLYGIMLHVPSKCNSEIKFV